MPFSFRQLVRQVPSRSLKLFFDSRGIEFGGAVDWSGEQTIVARQINKAMDGMSAADVAPLISDFERAHTLSDERGALALINAAPDAAAMLATFEDTENDQERALLTLVRDPKTFERAEDIRFFDYRIGGNYGRRFRCRSGLAVRRDSGSLDAFGRAVCGFHRRRDGSGRNHFAEVIDRNADGVVQVMIYVEGLASNRVEFGTDGLWRRPSRPAIDAAVVYWPSSGNIETVAKGGKPIHEHLRTEFAKHLLDAKPSFTMILPQRYRLAKLATMPVLPADPDDGLEAARVRTVKLLPPNDEPGVLVIEAPADRAVVTAPGLSGAWFAALSPLRRGFFIIEGTISFHFAAVERRQPRTIHAELGRNGSSNLNRLKQSDRQIVEKHLLLWDLVE